MIRIVVVDDQTLVRTGIRSLLALKGELEVVGEASDGVEALEIIAKTAPDVVLLDIRMPRLSGIEVLKELQAKPGMPAVLLLSTFDDDDALLEGMRFGAKGFLLKDVSLERLVESIKAVVVGGTLFRPGVTERNLASIKENQSTFLKLPLPDPLTSREKEVLALMADGFNNREISIALNVVEGTIKNHVSSVLSKLGVRDRTRAVLRGLELAII